MISWSQPGLSSIGALVAESRVGECAAHPERLAPRIRMETIIRADEKVSFIFMFCGVLQSLRFLNSSPIIMKCPLSRSSENSYMMAFSANWARSTSISTVLPSALA